MSEMSKRSIEAQNKALDQVIVSAQITCPPMGKGSVVVRFEDDSTKKLFEYYHDELTFHAHEFLGLTEAEGHALFTKKDIAFLQS